jgi:hypothetical protein
VTGGRRRSTAVLLVLILSAACRQGSAQKKLIAFGWDEPDTAYLRTHIGSMDTLPFDGCVFSALVRSERGREVNLAWHFWGRERFPPEAFESVRRDLWRAPRRAERRDFLHVNVTPGDLDWFEDFSTVLANARQAARLAREGDCAGLLLDTEPYQAPLFEYGWRQRATGRSWDDYARQVRQRGRELMHAFEQGFPGLRLFLTFGYELPWMELNNGRRSLADCPRGLLAPFVDGLVAGAHQARIVDGFEPSYGYRDPALFGAARRLLLDEVLPIVQDRERYHAVVSVGFGVWLDYDWRREGWHAEAPASNYFTPEALERSLCAALQAADEYVWLYMETPRRWTPEGPPRDLPPAYFDAIRRARACAGLPSAEPDLP